MKLVHDSLAAATGEAARLPELAGGAPRKVQDVAVIGAGTIGVGQGIAVVLERE